MILSKSTLIRSINAAERIAVKNQPDPEFVESAKKVDHPKVNNVSENTEECSMKDMIEVIQKIIENAKNKNIFVSGLTTRTIIDQYLFTKNGFEGYDRTSSFSNTMTMSDNINKEVS